MQKHVLVTEATTETRLLVGIEVVCDQICDDIRTDLPAVMHRVQSAMAAGEVTALKLALEALSKHLGNVQGNANAAVRLCCTHLNRRPRA